MHVYYSYRQKKHVVQLQSLNTAHTSKYKAGFAVQKETT